jgi:hypothetical protein
MSTSSRQRSALNARDVIEQRLLRGRLGVDVLGRATANSLTRPVPAIELRGSHRYLIRRRQ